MTYQIAHTLRLSYPAPVWEHHVEVRMAPQANPHQQVRALELSVDPDCELREYSDCFGNRVHYCSLTAPHDHLTVRMRARVDTSLDNPFDYAILPPGRERAWLDDRLRAEPRLWDYIVHRSPATPDLSALTAPAFTMPPRDPERTFLDAVMAALEWIGNTVEYEPGFAYAPAKLDAVMTRATGNCQDLAHLLISIVRAWGYAARYVMGYQDPSYAEEDGDSIQRSHAWAEILVPGAGWRGVDPTMRLVANQTYIAVAVGRDASDAMPIKAVFKGGEEVAPAETEVVLEVTRDQ